MHFLVADVPAVDVVDAARVAGGAAGAVADAGGDLLVGLHGAGGALGVAVCGERGEGEEEAGEGGGEFHVCSGGGGGGGGWEGWCCAIDVAVGTRYI